MRFKSPKSRLLYIFFLTTIFFTLCYFYIHYIALTHPTQTNEQKTQQPTQPLTQSSNELINKEGLNSTFFVPMVILGYQPDLLQRCIKSLLSAGASASLIYVFDDATSKNTADMVLGFGATVFTPSDCQNPNAAVRRESHLGYKYWCFFDLVFSRNSNYQSIISIEEDIVVSLDFLHYVRYFTPTLLNSSENVWCISGWNDNGFHLYAKDQNRIYKVEHFAGYGWSTSRERWENELKPIQDTNGVWDVIVSRVFHQKPNYCIVPEVARTRHVAGAKALSVGQELQVHAFDPIKLASIPHPKYYLETDERLQQQIAQGKIVKCWEEIIYSTNQTLILYISPNSSGDPQWNKIMIRFGMWGIGLGNVQRGVYKGLVTFPFATNFILIVAAYSVFGNLLTQKYENLAPLSELDNCSMKYNASPVWSSVVGGFGESCDSACEARGLRCSVDYFPQLLNYWEENSESKTVVNDISEFPLVVPYYLEPDSEKNRTIALPHPNYFNCLNCIQSNKAVQRVCPCV